MSCSTLAKPDVWVTYAVNDVDASQALKLCSSIRATSSDREVWIIIAPGLSSGSILALESSFDNVIGLVNGESKEAEIVGLSMDIKLSLNSWILVFLLVAFFLMRGVLRSAHMRCTTTTTRSWWTVADKVYMCAALEF